MTDQQAIDEGFAEGELQLERCSWRSVPDFKPADSPPLGTYGVDLGFLIGLPEDQRYSCIRQIGRRARAVMELVIAKLGAPLESIVILHLTGEACQRVVDGSARFTFAAFVESRAGADSTVAGPRNPRVGAGGEP